MGVCRGFEGWCDGGSDLRTASGVVRERHRSGRRVGVGVVRVSIEVGLGDSGRCLDVRSDEI
jgi:hypothetical protein